jgi:hypothetical protein
MKAADAIKMAAARTCFNGSDNYTPLINSFKFFLCEFRPELRLQIQVIHALNETAGVMAQDFSGHLA